MLWSPLHLYSDAKLESYPCLAYNRSTKFYSDNSVQKFNADCCCNLPVWVARFGAFERYIVMTTLTFKLLSSNSIQRSAILDARLHSACKMAVSSSCTHAENWERTTYGASCGWSRKYSAFSLGGIFHMHVILNKAQFCFTILNQPDMPAIKWMLNFKKNIPTYHADCPKSCRIPSPCKSGRLQAKSRVYNKTLSRPVLKHNSFEPQQLSHCTAIQILQSKHR